MTNNTSKNIRICGFVALAFCLVWAISIVFNITSNMFGGYASAHPIDWSKSSVMKAVVLICYVVGSVLMIALCIKAILNIFKGLRENNVFPRSNEKLLFWVALADFIRLLGSANFAVLWDDEVVLLIASENFVTPFFLLFFAFMYKVAADAVEENNLTI